MKMSHIKKHLFPDFSLDQINTILWECTPFPCEEWEDTLELLEYIAGIHAAGESFASIMDLFGGDE
jgi:hypothetical protein